MNREWMLPAGVSVLGIAQWNTSEEEVRQFVDQHALGFPNVYDPQGQLAERFGVNSVPTYVFLNAAGRVAEVSAGARGVEFIDGTMRRLLAE